MNTVDQYLGRERQTRRRQLAMRASFDAAQNTDADRKHWMAADSFSANAANDKETRSTLCDRANYEYANNPHLRGMVDQFTEDVIGTGPRLQLTIPGVPRKTAREIEQLYGYWCDQINYTEKLKIGNGTKVVQGETYGLEILNPTLDPFLPQLDLRLYEGVQVSTPYLLTYFDPLKIDGIEFDPYGNPQTYHLLKTHPGSEFGYMALEKEDIPAERMRHWFRPTRPGQARGIPEIMAALPLFAKLRRVTNAVVISTEFAATISGVLYTDAPVGEYESTDSAEGDAAAFDRVEYEPGALLTAPKGYKPEAFEPAQPFGQFKDFRHEILAEAGRSLDIPGHHVSGDYSDLNYSSGRLANLPYHRVIKGHRHACRARMLNPTFRSWLREAFLMGVFATLGELPPIALWSWRWDWDGFASVDPQKEATARQTLLSCGLTNEAIEYAADGLDWEEQLEQKAIILKRKAELEIEYGIKFESAAPAPTPAPVEPEPEEEEEPDEPQTVDAGAQVRQQFEASRSPQPELRALGLMMSLS